MTEDEFVHGEIQDVRQQTGTSLVGVTAYNAGVRASMRPNLSAEHLWAARHAAALALREEQAPGETPRFNIRHRAYVLNAITSSVAFMEAATNEVLQAAADNHADVSQFPQNTRTALAYFWTKSTGETSRAPVFDKYDLTLLIAGKAPMDRGRNPYADAKLVIQLRNWAIHYTPQWYHSDTVSTMEQKLTGKFDENALMKGSRNPVFPSQMLGAGCAKWAHEATTAFVEEWAATLGVTLAHQRSHYSPAPDE